MAYRIWKRFSFCASHALSHLPNSHKCSRQHGHNYRVELELEADKLGQDGFVLDYGALDTFKLTLDSAYDHRDLNEIMTELMHREAKSYQEVSAATTAESLAKHFYGIARGLTGANITAVRVSETDNTWAEYRP